MTVGWVVSLTTRVEIELGFENIFESWLSNSKKIFKSGLSKCNFFLKVCCLYYYFEDITHLAGNVRNIFKISATICQGNTFNRVNLIFIESLDTWHLYGLLKELLYIYLTYILVVVDTTTYIMDKTDHVLDNTNR